MKDRNNLLTSMIVALLAGIVYYLAGADSIERLAPQFGLIESNSQNKNDIEIVYSKADNNGDKSFEIKSEAPLKVKHVAKKNDVIEFEVNTDERELASSTKDVLKLDDAMKLLGSMEPGLTSLSKLDQIGNDFEWKSEQTEEIERPAIAWTESENSHSLKSRVKTKTPKVYHKAMAAIYLGEGDIMTGKWNIHNKTNAGEDKNKSKLPKQPAPDKKITEPTLINGNVIFIPDAKEHIEIKVDCNSNNTTQGNQNKNQNKNQNVNVNVQTSNGTSFIHVKTDDNGNTTCKVKCNK